MGAFDRVTPLQNFGVSNTCNGRPVGLGALELGIRWSYVDVPDGGGGFPFPGPFNLAGTGNNLTLGLDWYLNPQTRMMLNYIHSWSMVEPGVAVDDASTEKAVSELLRRESHAYVILWETLTKNEQRLLRGLADSDVPPKPFSSEFTRRYGLRSASNSQRAVESLLQKDVIDRERSSYAIVDRFLRLWLRELGRAR